MTMDPSNSYTNVTFRHADAMAVAKAVADMHRFNVISPVHKDCVVVFDRASDDNGELIVDFARIVSKTLDTTALAVMNHENSVLLYWLFNGEEELGSYVSRPNFFGGEPIPRGGDAITLANAWGQSHNGERVHEVLHGDAETDHGDYESEVHRHKDLVDALGLSHWAVGYGYTRLANDEFPGGFPPDDTFFTEPS